MENKRLIISVGSPIVGGSSEWGNITGILSNQTDLQTALDDKIESDDYASETVGGTLKARLSGNTLYLTNNGNNP